MARRTVLLTSALIVAALGTLLVFLYVRGADDRATTSRDSVEILVAAQTIEVNTSVQEAVDGGLFATQAYPRNLTPDGAVSSADALGDGSTVRQIRQGEPITADSFSDVEVTTPGSDLVPPGQLAISVTLGDPNRVANFLDVGNEIAIFVTGQTAEGQTASCVLLPEVTVLGIGDRSAQNDSGSEDADQQIVTLAVDQAQAQQVIAAGTAGELNFALLGEGTVVTPEPGCLDSILGGG